MLPYLRVLLLTVALCLISGCATVTRGTTETILVQSEPSGATVRLSNGFTGVTPASFTLSRKGDLVVSVSKEGYETAEIPLKSQIAGAGAAGMAGNVLIGGIIGIGVDAVTGATLSHYPNPVKTALIPLKVITPAATTSPLPPGPATVVPPSLTEPAAPSESGKQAAEAAVPPAGQPS